MKRVQVLEDLWMEFARENLQEIKETLPEISPWYAIQYWGARYADYVLQKDPRVIDLRMKIG